MAPARCWSMWGRACVTEVEGGEEVGGHGALVGFEGLVFDGADLDDAGVVDEDVELWPKVLRAVAIRALALFGVGEVTR